MRGIALLSLNTLFSCTICFLIIQWIMLLYILISMASLIVVPTAFVAVILYDPASYLLTLRIVKDGSSTLTVEYFPPIPCLSIFSPFTVQNTSRVAWHSWYGKTLVINFSDRLWKHVSWLIAIFGGSAVKHWTFIISHVATSNDTVSNYDIKLH